MPLPPEAKTLETKVLYLLERLKHLEAEQHTFQQRLALLTTQLVHQEDAGKHWRKERQWLRVRMEKVMADLGALGTLIRNGQE